MPKWPPFGVAKEEILEFALHELLPWFLNSCKIFKAFEGILKLNLKEI